MKTKITYIKSLLAAMVMLTAWMVPQTVWAENTITLGENGTQSVLAPILYNWRWGYTQQLYTKEEMGSKAQLIKKISFYYNGITNSSTKSKNNVKLYMGNTSKTYFSSSTDCVAFSDLTEVYSGSFDCTVGWNEITLSTPFAYNGLGSLVVALDDNTGVLTGGNGSTFRHSEKDSNMTLQFYSDAADINPSSLSGVNVSIKKSRVDTKFVTEDLLLSIDNGNEYTTSYASPVNNYFKYSYTQQLYTKAELGGKAQKIDKIHFYYESSNASTKKTNVVIYMGHTSMSSFSSTSDYVPSSSLTKVYSGNLNCKQGWNEFTLSTPFTYNGTDNLVVAVDDNSYGYDGTDYKFRHQKTTNSMTLVYYNDQSNPDPGSSSLDNFTYRAVLGTRVLTAFSITPLTFTLTTSVNDTSMGSVSGGGTYTYGTIVKLTATPETGYTFKQWDDGVTSATRNVTITGAATYTATFEPNKYEITVNTNNAAYGTVSGGGTYNYNSSQTITATPKTGYKFVSWSDGTKTYKAGDSNCVTDANGVNKLTITVPASKTTYTATFEPNKYEITVNTNNTAYGTVSGGGTYNYNSSQTITATPKTGYKFVSWNDGNTDASRKVTVTGAATYTATFAISSYTIATASNDPAKGTVSAGGTAAYNSELILTATPKTGYYFKQWNDGNFDNPRTVKYTDNVTYTATFVAPAPFDKKALNNALMAINNKGAAFTLTFDYTTPESYEGTPTSAGDNLRIFYTGTTDGKAHYTVAPSYSGGPIIAPADCSELFKDLGKMTSIEFRNFNTEKVTNMSSMFFSCEALTTLDLSSFNTEKVTNMNCMFMYCEALTTLYLSSLNTEEVTDMNCMFFNCEALTTLDLSSFHTEEVTNMSGMFFNCEALTTLDLSSFNTAKVTDMNCMFFSCQALTTLDLSSFNTAKVTDMNSMFTNCQALTTLDLSSFNTAKVTDMNHMFYDCNKLRGIKVGYEFTTDVETNSESMFEGCTQLVGPKGTTYNGAFVDKSYAHVDGGKSNPGYFTSSEYTIVDISLLIQALQQGKSVSDLPFADVNGDGKLDLNDITSLRNLVLEITGKDKETLPGDGNEPTPDDNGNFNAESKRR